MAATPHPVDVGRSSRRIFLATIVATAAVALGWAATGAPFPGAVIEAQPEDLIEPSDIIGVWGVTPTSIAVERLDGVALSENWTGITARYTNSDGTVQIFAYVGNTSFGALAPGAAADPDTELIHGRDSAGTHGTAVHWSLPGRRYAGVSVWATDQPDDVEEFLVALRDHATGQ